MGGGRERGSQRKETTRRRKAEEAHRSLVEPKKSLGSEFLNLTRSTKSSFSPVRSERREEKAVNSSRNEESRNKDCDAHPVLRRTTVGLELASVVRSIYSSPGRVEARTQLVRGKGKGKRSEVKRTLRHREIDSLLQRELKAGPDMVSSLQHQEVRESNQSLPPPSR